MQGKGEMSATQGNGNGSGESPLQSGRGTLRVIHRIEDVGETRNSRGATSSEAPNVISSGRLAQRMVRQWQSTTFFEDLNTAG